jgi:hypothetical protein
VTVDADLLVGAVAALVLGASPLLEGDEEHRVTLGVKARDGFVSFIASHDEAELPHAWRSILAEDAWDQAPRPGSAGVTFALTLLRAAKLVAEMHGGGMSIDCADGSTTLSIALPVKR